MQEVEELVLECCQNYDGQWLVQATIHDQKHELHVVRAIGRDIQKEKVDDLISQLEGWVKSIDSIEKDGAKQIQLYNENVSASQTAKAKFLADLKKDAEKSLGKVKTALGFKK